MNEQTQRLLGLMGPGAGSVVSRTFALMGVCEEVLADSGLSRKQQGRVFAAACPSPVLSGKGAELYRAHVQELVARVRTDAPLGPGTEAEVLAGLLDASLVAPPPQAQRALTDYLFTRLFPRQARNILGSDTPPTPETFRGQVQEDLGDARRRLHDGKRAEL